MSKIVDQKVLYSMLTTGKINKRYARFFQTLEPADESEAVVTTTSGNQSGDSDSDNVNNDVELRSASAAGEGESNEVSVEGLGKAVKRAMEDFSAAISSKPSKKPRYSNT